MDLGSLFYVREKLFLGNKKMYYFKFYLKKKISMFSKFVINCVCVYFDRGELLFYDCLL